MTFNPLPKETSPDLVKHYPCRPKLAVHIFFPPGSQPTQPAMPNPRQPPPPSSTKLLPLYIDIHGGGFAVGTAAIDNAFSRSWSRRTTMLVASLNYTKAPQNPYPAAIHDIAQLASAVINDPTLPIDRARIVIGGFSAGGLLSLSAPQVAPLKGQIHAAVAYYPIVDFSEYPATKWEKRLDRSRKTERLATFAGALDWGYVNPGHDRRDKMLSPYYAYPEDLAPHVCVVGAQRDAFCRETRDMIFDLAGRRTDAGDGDEGWMQGFEQGTYKWVFAKGMTHAFTEEVGRKKGPWDVKRSEYCETVYEDVYQWLRKTVL